MYSREGKRLRGQGRVLGSGKIGGDADEDWLAQRDRHRDRVADLGVGRLDVIDDNLTTGRGGEKRCFSSG